MSLNLTNKFFAVAQSKSPKYSNPKFEAKQKGVSLKD